MILIQEELLVGLTSRVRTDCGSKKDLSHVSLLPLRISGIYISTPSHGTSEDIAAI